MLHPGSCTQSVPPALAIFDESVIVTILSYFPKRQDAAGFLQVFSNWWILSSSKQKIHGRNRLGNAAVPLDNKSQSLRALADWITEWQKCKLPNCKRFQFSAQTSDALTRILRCQAALIEGLLETQQYEYYYRRFNAIVSQLKISLFWVIYIIQKPRYCCVGRRKLVILHALFGN